MHSCCTRCRLADWIPPAVRCRQRRSRRQRLFVRLAVRGWGPPDSPYRRGAVTRPACLLLFRLQVKSDEHMAKVKEQLLFEKQQIEAAEQR